jgi:dihydrolipoamide dehydrogenase
MERYDVVVIGGGPGGYTAAIRARQLGLTCALVERDQLGGICLNWGCIPTKTLLHAAEVKHMAETATAFGLTIGEVSVDLPRLVKRSRQIAQRLVKGVAFLMKKNGVDVVAGEAMLTGPGAIRVATTNGDVPLSATNVILATGARPRTLAGLEPDGERIVTYREAMVPKVLPDRLLVVGAGAIGIEFASLYADLGTQVTVVEVADRILPQEDEEISQLALTAFERRGIRFHTGAKVSATASDGGGLAAVVALGEGRESPLSVDQILVAAGITGNVENIGLEDTRVVVERGHVVVDERGRTAEPGVFAIGDLTGPPWLAHKASHEGVACVEFITGARSSGGLDATRIPACTYSRPQIASVGLTEAAALAAGREVRVGRFPFQANAMALANEDKGGLVKTVVDSTTGELLGAHMIGGGVAELIHGFAIALTLEARDVDLMDAVFPHPTLSEMMHESILDAADRALNI